MIVFVIERDLQSNFYCVSINCKESYMLFWLKYENVNFLGWE